MIEYIKGEITEITPTYAILECGGIGYFTYITLNTYSDLKKGEKEKLFVYEIIREDTHQLYGFSKKRERELFTLLISVSGVGGNTARMILSSFVMGELEQVIAGENVNILKSVKGIGNKTAQRIIIELKDKINSNGTTLSINPPAYNAVQEEAIAALQMLGFAQTASTKVVQKILADKPTLKVEEVIKAGLKML